MSAAHDERPRLDKYDILEELGHGGMATVYRALDRRLGREVAVKVMHRHLRDDTEVAARFDREARAVAKLRHPNIVEVYDISEPRDRERYLTVELVRGPTLRKLVSERGSLPSEVAALIGIEIADALQHAHDHGVVHRDVKPENVLLALPRQAPSLRPGEARPQRDVYGAAVKITDFGIAKVLDVQGVTSTGEVLGSPAHMAPEQIEGRSLGPTTDVFALGVLLYECMVGKLPFDGANPAQVLRRVLEGTFVAAERARPTVGAELSRILTRALEHEPKDRYASAAELAAALGAEVERLGFSNLQDELTPYLLDAESYQRSYEERITHRLMELGQRAREQGEVARAASALNRALAFRPDDPELIAAVASMSRRQRVARSLRRFVIWGLVALSLVVLALVVIRVWPRQGMAGAALERIKPPTARSAVTVSKAAPPASSRTVKPRSSAQVPRSETPPTPRNTNHSGGSRQPATVDQQSRAVRVVITGVSGSRLRIDGVERSWFAVQHQLAVGQHLFEVVPPNEKCCVAPKAELVSIEPGSGLQTVTFAVEFRKATLQLAARDGTTLSCGELFRGKLEVPGRTSVAIQVKQSRTLGTCSLVPPPGSVEGPKKVDVVLQPGETYAVGP